MTARHSMIHIFFVDVGGDDYFLDFMILSIGGTELIQIEYYFRELVRYMNLHHFDVLFQLGPWEGQSRVILRQRPTSFEGVEMTSDKCVDSVGRQCGIIAFAHPPQ
jgi:hypothetical protein